MATIPLALALFAFAQQPTLAQSPTGQVLTVSGRCILINVQVAGNLTVNCPGVDPRALKVLNQKLATMKGTLEQKIEEANSWANRYKELERQLSDVSKDNKLWEEAETDLHAGDLEAAGDALDRLIAILDKKAAPAHFSRGLLFQLQFRPVEALHEFAIAYSLDSTEPKYGFEYASALLVQNDFKSAFPVLATSRDRARQLATTNPQIYQPDLADLLNLLGFVYLRTDHMKEAEEATREALEFRRQVAKREPTLQPLVVESLKNLARIYSRTQRTVEAWSTYQEAVEVMNSLPPSREAERLLAELMTDIAVFWSATSRIEGSDRMFESALKLLRQMAKGNRGYEPTLAHTLVLVARHHGDNGQPQEAETEYNEALGIQRRFAKDNPEQYQDAVATTLNWLGRLYSSTNQTQKAEAAYREALDIRVNLAKLNPSVFDQNVADTKFGLGNVYYATGRYTQAEEAYIDARRVYDEHWKADSRSDGGELVFVLRNLALLHERTGNLGKAVSEATDAVDVSRTLWATKPDLAGDLLAESLLVLAQVRRSANPSAEVCALLSEAVKAAQKVKWKTRAANEEWITCPQSYDNSSTAGHPSVASDSDAKALFSKVLASAYPKESFKDIHAVLAKQSGTRMVEGKVEQFSRETLRILPDRIHVVIVPSSAPMFEEVITPTMGYRTSAGKTLDLPSSYVKAARTFMKFDMIYVAQHPGEFDVSLAGTEQLGEITVQKLSISTSGGSQMWEVDPATGRVLRIREITPSGKETVEEYSDFRLASGIDRPYKVSVKQSGITTDYVTLQYIVNPQVDEQLFVHPNSNK